MDPYGSLRGLHSLQTASEVKSDLVFEISDPNYLLIYVHIAYMVWALLAACEATTASKVKSDLRFEISDPNYLQWPQIYMLAWLPYLQMLPAAKWNGGLRSYRRRY